MSLSKGEIQNKLFLFVYPRQISLIEAHTPDTIFPSFTRALYSTEWQSLVLEEKRVDGSHSFQERLAERLPHVCQHSTKYCLGA